MRCRMSVHAHSIYPCIYTVHKTPLLYLSAEWRLAPTPHWRNASWTRLRLAMPEPPAGSATADQLRRHSMELVLPSIGSVSRESVNAACPLAECAGKSRASWVPQGGGVSATRAVSCIWSVLHKRALGSRPPPSGCADAPLRLRSGVV